MTDARSDWIAQPSATRIARVVLVALVFLAYLPVLSSDFVDWDDDTLLTHNPAVTSAQGLRHIWSTLELPASFPNYPLLFTSYWIEYRLWGSDPRGYHFTNLLLHMLNTFLVWRLARRLGASEWAAGVVAALFGLHPMQVESVAWVVERKNVLSATFYLAAFLAYLQHRETDRWDWYGLSLVTFAAAMLSKTASLTLPASLLLWERLRAGAWRRAALLRAVPLILVGSFGIITTIAVEPSHVAIPWALRALLAAQCLVFYVMKLVAPIGLLPIYRSWDIEPAQIQWWLPLIGVVGAAMVIARSREWLIRWGAGHFVCTLAPVLGLLPFGYHTFTFVADHYVYLACIGLFLPIALIVDRWRAHAARLITTASVIVVAALGVLTWRQTLIWSDALTFWTHAADGNPTAWVTQVNLGQALIQRERFADAMAATTRALALRPDDPVALNNMGLALLRSDQATEAVVYLRRAVAVDALSAERRKNLAAALLANGQPADAEAELRAALAIQPDNVVSHYLLARALRRQGNASAAVTELEITLGLQPDFQPAVHALAEIRASSPTAPAAP